MKKLILIYLLLSTPCFALSNRVMFGRPIDGTNQLLPINGTMRGQIDTCHTTGYADTIYIFGRVFNTCNWKAALYLINNATADTTLLDSCPQQSVTNTTNAWLKFPLYNETQVFKDSQYVIMVWADGAVSDSGLPGAYAAAPMYGAVLQTTAYGAWPSTIGPTLYASREMDMYIGVCPGDTNSRAIYRTSELYDNTIRNPFPNLNCGGDDQIIASRVEADLPTPFQRFWLYFNAPAGTYTSVTACTAFVYLEASPAFGQANDTVDFFWCTQNVVTAEGVGGCATATAGEMCWDSAITGTLNWTSDGGDYSTTDTAFSIAVDAAESPALKQAPLKVAQIDSILNGTKNNYGLIAKKRTESSGSNWIAVFTSSENNSIPYDGPFVLLLGLDSLATSPPNLRHSPDGVGVRHSPDGNSVRHSP